MFTTTTVRGLTAATATTSWRPCGFHGGVDLGLRVRDHGFLAQEDGGEWDDLLLWQLVHGFHPDRFTGCGFHSVDGLGRVEEGGAEDFGIVFDLGVEHLVAVE
ncbi:hypothetical protein [Pseudarthrobacter sp. NamE2]|uniref:hypothetical protein n=1 Tax=Pseudarthrobacter sp. NamE2 TaxID=2576838 RepID=UPI001F10FD47|nr:hypothetical protein [Pseudarthrobacter sp. NamE2]